MQQPEKNRRRREDGRHYCTCDHTPVIDTCCGVFITAYVQPYMNSYDSRRLDKSWKMTRHRRTELVIWDGYPETGEAINCLRYGRLLSFVICVSQAIGRPGGR